MSFDQLRRQRDFRRLASLIHILTAERLIVDPTPFSIAIGVPGCEAGASRILI